MSRKVKILIVEDEEPILRGLEDVLTYHGFEVAGETDGAAGCAKALSGGFDLILLDLMLPSMNGFEVCDRIREVDRETSIVMLTASASDDDIVNGLQSGADDYITKPFSIRELVARIEAVLRRSGRTIDDRGVLRIGNLTLDLGLLEGTNGTEIIGFTRREIDMLVYLARRPKEAVSREQLLRDVWGYQNVDQLETRTVDIHVAKLRRKIEPDPANPRFLRTIRGEGYRLVLIE